MASVSTVSIKFTGDAKQLEDTFTKVGVKANLLASGIQSAFNATVGLAKSFVSTAIEAAKTNESTLVSFENLTGSIGEAKTLYKDLLDFASKTPFSVQQINSGAVSLLGFGLSAKDASAAIKDLGAAAAANADTDLKRLVVSYGQIQGANVAMTRDLREFVNNGIPIYKLLADTLDVSVDKINEMASAGEITGDVIARVFREAASEGGRFENTLAAQSQTLAGLTSTLKDNFAITLGKIGDKLLPAAREAAIGFNNILLDLQKYFESDAGEQWALKLAAAVRAGFATAGTEIKKALLEIDLAFAKTVATFTGFNQEAVTKVKVIEIALDAVKSSTVSFEQAYEKALEDIGRDKEWKDLLGNLDSATKAFDTFDNRNKVTGGGKGDGGKAAEAARKAREAAFKAEIDYLVRLRGAEEDADKDFEDRLKTRLRKEEEALREKNKLLEQYGKEAAAIQKAVDDQVDKELDAKARLAEAAINATADDEQLKRSEILANAKESEAKAIALAASAASTYKSALAAAHQEGITGARAHAKAVIETAKQVIGAQIREGVSAYIAGILQGPAGKVPFLGLALAAAGGIAAEALFRSLLSSIKIPAFGDGGIVYGPTLALIGEKGPEAIVPLNGRSGRNTMDVNIRGVEYGGDRYWLNEQANILGRLTNG